MIYTVTLNPSIDYYLYLNDLKRGETNRSKEEYTTFGGKGFNVSKMLKGMNQETQAIGYVAGKTGKLFEELIKEYEKYGAYNELISLFETNLVGERNHIITELAILYAKYLPSKLMDHCRNCYSNMNVPKVIRVCEQCYLWEEVVFLYSHYNGYDNALHTMIEHSPLCWKHDLFCQTLSKVTNSNLYNESIHFYMNEQPALLNDMLKVKVENPTLCPRYIARAVTNVKIGPSPRWIRERLRTSGVRPINNIVDITNFVMLEYINF